jgi:hypothetical protein
MDSQLIKVSIYKDAEDVTGKEIGLLRWLEGFPELNIFVDQIRQEPDKDKRDKLKKKLYAITPAGTFSYRNDKSLLMPSGFMALDFDHLEDPEKTKQFISDIENVFYCGLSASGAGLWALIPIKYPEHYARHYEALESDFKALGLITDPKCRNISRLRFYSYDTQPFFNIEAVIYEKLAPEHKQTILPPMEPYRGNNSPLESLIRKIERTHTDITTDYHDWLKLGGALASIYGSDGLQIYHRISRFYSGYDPEQTDKQFSACLRKRGNFTESMIFSIAKKYNLTLKK